MAFGPDSPSAESPAPDLERVETVEKEHGRIEIRRLESTASLNDHLAEWPGVQHEDECRTAAPNAARPLAAFRNTILTCLRRLGFPPVEGIEPFAEHRAQALDLIRTGRTE